MDQAQLKAELALHIESRSAEVDQYQMNVDNYTQLLAGLPSVWPEELLQFKGMTVEKIITTAVNGEDIFLISDLVLFDKITISLKQEQLQQRIASKLKDVLVARHDAIEL